jgi:hypothetical protein
MANNISSSRPDIPDLGLPKFMGLGKPGNDKDKRLYSPVSSPRGQSEDEIVVESGGTRKRKTSFATTSEISSPLPVPVTVKKKAEKLQKQRWHASAIGEDVKDLKKAYEAETTRWSVRYKSEPAFKERIDRFYTERQQLIADINADRLSAPEIDRRSMLLGTQLAIAFGAIDERGAWDPEFASGIEVGGADYVESTIRANFMQQTPGILRSVAILGTYATLAVMGFELEKSLGALCAMLGINAAYAIAQMAVSKNVPVWQSAAQSRGVARRTHHGPAFQPNVVSSKLVLEDGTLGELKGPALRLKKIKNLQALLHQGTDRLLRERLQRLDGHVERLKREIAELKTQMVSVVDRAKPGRYQKMTKLAEQLQEKETEQALYRAWAELQQFCAARPETEDTYTALDGAVIQAITKEIMSHRLALVFELAYVGLNIQANTAFYKNIRNFWNIATALISLIGSYLSQNPEGSALTQTTSLISQLFQVVFHRFQMPKGSAADYASQLTAQFKVAALTGVANLAPKGQPNSPTPDPKKLDAIMVGPIKRRVDSIVAVLEHDQAVYRAAFLTATSSNGVMPWGSYQESVAHFTELKSHEARMNTVDVFVADKWLDIDAMAVQQARLILDLYAENEVNIARFKAKDFDELLGERNATLPNETKRIFRGALKHAAGVASKDESRKEGDEKPQSFEECDDTLAEWKGLTESLSDLGSVNQAAQKIGQTVALFVAGPTTPLVLKLMSSMVQAVLYGHVAFKDLDPDARKVLLGAIKDTAVTGNAVSIVGSCVALVVAYSAHENIATKARHRQRDRSAGAAMPNAGIWSTPFMTWILSKPTGFETLAARQILSSPDPTPYTRQVNLAGDILDEVLAPSLRKIGEYLGIKPTSFIFETEEDAQAMIKERVGDLNRIATKLADEQSQDKVERGDPGESQPRSVSNARGGSNLGEGTGLNLQQTRPRSNSKGKDKEEDEEVIGETRTEPDAENSENAQWSNADLEDAQTKGLHRRTTQLFGPGSRRNLGLTGVDVQKVLNDKGGVVKGKKQKRELTFEDGLQMQPARYRLMLLRRMAADRALAEDLGDYGYSKNEWWQLMQMHRAITAPGADARYAAPLTRFSQVELRSCGILAGRIGKDTQDENLRDVMHQVARAALNELKKRKERADLDELLLE